LAGHVEQLCTCSEVFCVRKGEYKPAHKACDWSALTASCRI
jgi:hypothetical protein